MGSSPPPHMFSNAAKSRGSRTQRTALVSPFGVCSVGLFVRTSSLWARFARTTITGNRWATRCPPAGRAASSRTPRRSQRSSGALSPSVPTTRGPGGARAGGNQKLDPPPGPGYLSIPPAAPFRPTHAGPRLRLSFDSGPPAQLTGTGLHTPWAWDRLGPTSAHDCGCPSIPGLRPS